MTNPDHDEAAAAGQAETTAPKKLIGHGTAMPSYLTPAHIHAAVTGYPEQVRAGVRWLADYCREKCQSDHKILAAHTAQAKSTRSFSYFYTLFRGTHNFSGEDSVEKFLALLVKMKAYAAEGAQRTDVIFGDFDLYDDFEAIILSRRKAHICNRLVLQSGPTGSGKSALQKEFIRRHGAKLQIARIESAANPSLWAWQAIIRPALGIALGGRSDLHSETIIANAKAYDILFLDDCHRLYRERMGTNQHCWNFIQRLQDETNCVIVVSMTDVFAQDIRKIRYFDQFFGRAGGRGNLFQMPLYPEDDHLLAVAKAYGLLDARKALDELRRAAHGFERLRPLQDALAMARADAADGKFDLEALREFLPPPPTAEDFEQITAKKGRR